MYDTKLPVGAAKSPQIFQRLSSAVWGILKKIYDYTAIAYLDDFLIFGKSFAECSNTMHTLNMSYGATVGASAANSNLIEFKKIIFTPILNKSYVHCELLTI